MVTFYDSDRGMATVCIDICAVWCQQPTRALSAGRYGVAEPAEVRLFPFAHQLKMQRLLTEGALSRGVGPQLQTDLLPGMHQSL